MGCGGDWLVAVARGDAVNLKHLEALGADGPTLTPAPWRFSASQLKTYHDCPRKWFFAKVLGYPEPTSPAAELGRKLHAEVEAYFVDGVVPETLEARLLLEGLPERRDDLVVEGQATIHVYPGRNDGPRFTGFIDLIEPADPVVIWDHKTTSSLRWAKSEYELKHDIQMVSYAHFYFLADSTAQEVEVVHNYVTTKGTTERRIVRARLTRDEVEARWGELVELMETMEATRALGDVREVTKNESACSKYGGCAHRENCARASFGRPIAMFNPPDAPKPDQPETEAPAPSDALAHLRSKVSAVKSDPVPPELDGLNFTTRALRALADLNITTEAELVRVKASQISELKGIGAKTVEEIMDMVDSLREVETDVGLFDQAEKKAEETKTEETKTEETKTEETKTEETKTEEPYRSLLINLINSLGEDVRRLKETEDEPPAAPTPQPPALPVASSFFEGAAGYDGAVDFESVVEWARALGLKLTIEVE